MIELDFSSIPTIVGVSIACLIVISLIFVLSMDARIVDMNGKRLPGPRSNFFGKTFVSVMQKARQMKQVNIFGDLNVIYLRYMINLIGFQGY